MRRGVPPAPQAENWETDAAQPGEWKTQPSEKSPRALYAGETTVDESAWWDDDGEYLGEMPDWREVRRRKALAAEAAQQTAEDAFVDDYFGTDNGDMA